MIDHEHLGDSPAGHRIHVSRDGDNVWLTSRSSGCSQFVVLTPAALGKLVGYLRRHYLLSQFDPDSLTDRERERLATMTEFRRAEYGTDEQWREAIDATAIEMEKAIDATGRSYL